MWLDRLQRRANPPGQAAGCFQGVLLKDEERVV